MSNQLTFRNIVINPVNHNGKIWLSSVELAKALQYSNYRSVSKIYNQYADEFIDGMVEVIESVTSGNYRKKERLFSLRGCHLIAIFSRTDVAKDFRKWVLDILDKESGVKVIDNYITHAEQQEYKRAINRCVERTKEHCNLIDLRVCQKFNVESYYKLLSSQLEDVYHYLSTLTKKDIVGKRYLVEVKITDYMFNGEKTINGRCNDFNALLTNLALNLGYKIERLSENPQTLSF